MLAGKGLVGWNLTRHAMMVPSAGTKYWEESIASEMGPNAVPFTPSLRFGYPSDVRGPEHEQVASHVGNGVGPVPHTSALKVRWKPPPEQLLGKFTFAPQAVAADPE